MFLYCYSAVSFGTIAASMKSRVPSLLAVSLCACAAAFAQGTTSRVLGTVQDPSGAVIAGAGVKLINEGTRVSFSTTTSAAGTYVFEAVQPGHYELNVEAAGFRKYVTRSNSVSIGQPATINVKLELGATTDKVEVSATTEAVQTSASGNFGNVVTQQQVADLPVVTTRGRNPLNLVIMQPGVVNGANTGGGSHVHGARDRAWNYTLDGIDVNDSSQGGSETTSFRVNPDMLSEMRVLTGNNTAEYGRNSGGQVAMMTRSGTNQFHGDGFWFYRTPRLSANEWESNVNGLRRTQLQQNIFGGGIGGPVIRNKTFFFFQIQALRARTSAGTTRTVYTELARQGILRYVKGGRNLPNGVAGASVDASGNVASGVSVGTYNVAANDPQNLGLDTSIQTMLKDIPLPNSFATGDGLNTAGYVFSAQASERQHDQTVKIDHVINTQNNIYGRLAWGRDNSNCDTTNSGQPMFPGQPCLVNTLRGPRNFAVNWRFTPNARTTNEFVVGQNRYDPIFGQPSSLEKLSIASAPIDNTWQYYFGNQRVVSTWQVVDNLAYFRGAHSMKFGFNLRRNREEDQRGSVAGLNAAEEINFSTSVNTVDPTRFGIPSDINTTYDRPNMQSNINFLLGRVGQIDRGFVAKDNAWTKGTFQFDTRFPEYEFYGQDTWKVRPNLTVEIGLRWELRLSPSTPSGNILVPNQPIVAGGTANNAIQWTKGNLFSNQFGNIGPSLGFAWDPTGSGKTSIRSNYRTAYDRINMFVIASTILPNLPGASYPAINTDFGQGGGRLSSIPELLAPTTKPSDLTTPQAYNSATNTAIDPNLKTAKTHQWSLNVQREIAKNTVLEAAYIGRRAYHLLGAYNANQADIKNNGFLDAFATISAGGESTVINNVMKGDTRINTGETASAMIRRLYASQIKLNSVGEVAKGLASRIQSGQSVTAMNGQPYFFYKYPQYTSAMNVIDSNDFSTYHSLEIQVQRRMSNGIAYQIGYTLAKSLDTRSFDPTLTVVGTGNASTAGSTPLDINNRKLNYAPSDFDRRHSLQANAVWELPFGKGKKWLAGAPGFVDKIVGGWELAGFMRTTSGRPFTVWAGAYTYSSVNQATANCNGCSRGDGTPFLDSASGLIWYFNKDQRAKFSTPTAGSFGNTGRNFFLGPHYWVVNSSLLKRIDVTERVKMELRGEATNLTNSVMFGNPTTDITSSTFGRIRDTTTSGSRKVQVGAKIHF
jgi:hypothetical protein